MTRATHPTRTVFVPVSAVAIGWGPRCRWAEVTDAKTGERRRFPRDRTRLLGCTLCVPARSLAVEDGLHCVRIVGVREPVWVRLAVAEGEARLVA
ncbi:hypothetical protein [Limnoglobus roseus]|uniref:Uncharacterized protein n=1 Tax=Limnoglobus roseus TaxID=2598579 RepID=A0A5C1AMK4_9BACT|nr:hypothetical protein [Limnoglobus roseus]QEL19815.1 hypothetical protein PX52LOC_06895 [Limnoglobus roseus]